MQLLAKETISQSNPSDCSAQLIEVTHLLMRRIRREMRSRTIPGLSVPQFRTLNYLKMHPRSTLSDVAGHLGLTLPSTSKLIQNMVEQKIVVRRRAADRRQVSISLTEDGITALAKARLETQQQLAESLKSLTQEELFTISAALHILNSVFSGGGTGVGIP